MQQKSVSGYLQKKNPKMKFMNYQGDMVMRSRAEEIYHAALSLDKSRLGWLASITSLDEWWPGSYFEPAICKLTQDALPNREAIELLLECGASLHFAVYGAALGKNWELMQDFLKRGAAPSLAAQGASQAKNKLWREYFEKNGVSPTHFLKGALLAGDTDYVLSLLSEYPQIADRDTLVLFSLYTNQHQQFKRIMKQYLCPAEEIEPLKNFAYAFQNASNLGKLKKFLEEKKEKLNDSPGETRVEEEKKLYWRFLSGIALAGCYSNLVELLSSPDITQKYQSLLFFEELVGIFFFTGRGEMAYRLMEHFSLSSLKEYTQTIVKQAIRGHQFGLLEIFGVRECFDHSYFSKVSAEVPFDAQKKRFNTISYEIQRNNLSVKQAFFKRNPQDSGALSLLVSLYLKEKSSFLTDAPLPAEIWLEILRFLTPGSPPSANELEVLGIFMAERLKAHESVHKPVLGDSDSCRLC